MSALSRRTIHLDFHTAPQIPDVGARFDSAAFAKTFERAGVDSVTVFAKCHHGHLYYDTDRAERHPTLSRDLNLLDEQVEALHSVGIRAPIYLSVQFDEYAANTHPEWLAIQPNGRQWKRTDRFEAGWQVLDMASPYQDYLADQLAEVLDHFGTVDGIFLDICMDIPSTSVWAVEAMRRRGQDPASEHDRDDHARQTARDYMHRYRQMILPHLAGDAPTSVWFNSRPKTALSEELPFVDHVEIEALPTGGWGYTYLPYVARLVRPMGHRALAHTARFHKSWGDNAGLKPAAALDYECAQMLTYGITACVGDVLHPSGTLAEPAYDLIEHSYRHLKECEPFVAQARPVAEIGVVMDLALGDEPGDVAIGLVRALQQLRQQFDVIGLDADLSGYRLIVVPETTVVDAELARRLLAFREAGGRLLLSGAALDNGHGEPCLPGLGITIEGPSPYSHVFWRKADGSDDFPHVDYENGLRLLATEDGVVRYTVVEPYFERTWDQFCGHDYTRPGQPVCGRRDHRAHGGIRDATVQRLRPKRGDPLPGRTGGGARSAAARSAGPGGWSAARRDRGRRHRRHPDRPPAQLPCLAAGRGTQPAVQRGRGAGPGQRSVPARRHAGTDPARRVTECGDPAAARADVAVRVRRRLRQGQCRYPGRARHDRGQPVSRPPAASAPATSQPATSPPATGTTAVRTSAP